MSLERLKRSELAEKCGISAAAVSKACKTILKNAVDGKYIDANHPDVMDYMRKHGAISGRKNGRPRKKDYGKPKPEQKLKTNALANEHRKIQSAKDLATGKTVVHEIPAELEPFMNKTVGEIVAQFGTVYAFNDWLRATREIETINATRLKNATARNELVNKNLFKISFIDPVNEAHTKLLSDGSKTIAKRICAMHDSGSTLPELQKFVSGQITSFLRPMKSKMKKALDSVFN